MIISRPLKGQSKIELLFFGFAVLSLIIAIFLIRYIDLNFINYNNQIANGNRLVTLYKFEDAIAMYKNIPTIFPNQRDHIDERIKNAEFERENHYNLTKGQAFTDVNDYTDALTYLYLISQDSQDYNEAQQEITTLQQEQTNEDSVQSQVNALLAKANNEQNLNQLQKAQNDYISAYQIASADIILNADQGFISTIKTNISNLKVAIQKQIDLSKLQTTQKIYALSVPILMYHYIRVNPVASDTLGFSLSVTPSDFDAQMNYIASNGYTTITMLDLVNALRNRTGLPPKPIVLTFDDGYLDFYTAAYPVLKKYNLKAESYVITNFVGQPNYMTWDMIKELSNSGLITIGSHTLDHPDLRYVSLSKLDHEVRDSKAKLESELNKPITDFCYPFGGYNSIAEQEVQKAGYTDATTTVYSALHYANDFFNIPRIRIPGGLAYTSFISRVN